MASVFRRQHSSKVLGPHTQNYLLLVGRSSEVSQSPPEASSLSLPPLTCPLLCGAAPSWRECSRMWCSVGSPVLTPHWPSLCLGSFIHFCSCLRNHHQFSGLKQRALPMSQFWWVSWVLCPGPREAAVRAGAGYVVELGSSSKLAAAGVLQFLAIAGLRPSAPGGRLQSAATRPSP